MDTYILGIESSCDDTSASVIKNTKILANVVSGQQVHEFYGGVVPELASRAHQQNIIPVVHRALEIAKVSKNQLHAVAFTNGPGLLGSLLVGASFAKSFALALDIPIIQVHHMQAHILAHFIEDQPGKNIPAFPFLCLTVSGGHTQIVRIDDHLSMTVLGSTLDDAAGEAFDKAAKIMGLPYPGGPVMDKKAKEGDPRAFSFSKPEVPDLNYSFSGLKTGILYFLRDQLKKDENFIENNMNDLCASIQHTIVDILMDKLIKAVKTTGINRVAIAGGVSANSGLRQALYNAEKEKEWKVYIPKFEYTTDNAAMIAVTGYFKYLRSDFAPQTITPFARYDSKAGFQS